MLKEIDGYVKEIWKEINPQKSLSSVLRLSVTDRAVRLTGKIYFNI